MSVEVLLTPSLIRNSLFTIWVGHATYITCKVTFQLAKSSICNCLSLQKETFQNKGFQSKVLFFPDQKETCKKYLNGLNCEKVNCLYGHDETSLGKLVRCLSSAEKMIDVCVFTITSPDLADVLIKKHQNGVIVRVVTDCEKMDLNCSQIEQMRANGIQVRHDKTSYFMHHKFAIVDKTVLVNGSFNWTRQAITGNQENVIISKRKELLVPYCAQFEKLWKIYKPAQSIM